MMRSQAANTASRTRKNKKEPGSRFSPSAQPLHIEIGMGKGRFLMDMAASHPDINYLGIERYSSVLYAHFRKWN